MSEVVLERSAVVDAPAVGQAERPEIRHDTYRPDIDGLRAVAVLAVIAYHATGWGGGFVGVDVFFVISGYLIVGIIEGEIRDHRFSVVRFYERRVRRLFPAFFVVAAATAVSSFWLLMPTDLAAFGRSLVAATAFLSNVQFWRETGYFDTQSAVKPLLHTWSLAVEEQFYLVIPGVMLACHRVLRRGALWAMPAIFAGSLALSIWMTVRMPSASFYLPFGRAWELALGGCILLLPRLSADWVSAAGLGLIGLSVVLYATETPFPGIAALLPCLGSAAVLYGARSSLGSRLLKTGPMVYIGKISYPLYLWHWPLLAVDRYALGKLSPAHSAGAVLAAFGLAALTYHFIEQPIRTRRWLASRRTLFAIAALGSTLLIGAGAGLVISRGAPQRLPVRAVIADAAASDRTPPDCHNRTAADVQRRRLCVIGAAVPPTVVLWGDSQGWAAQDGYASALEAKGLAAYVATRDGCVPAVGVVRVHYDTECQRFAAAVAHLAVSARARAVILVGAWKLYTNPAMHADGLTGWPATNAGLKHTVAILRSVGARVVLADPPPGALLPAPRGLAQKVAYGRTMPLAVTTAEFLAQPYFRTVKELGTPRIEAWRALCAATCAVERNGRPLYIDTDHIARSQAGFEVPFIEAALTDLH
jgi:peptidoglycan/LPS O-acetylase OafA/YrhL